MRAVEGHRRGRSRHGREVGIDRGPRHVLGLEVGDRRAVVGAGPGRASTKPEAAAASTVNAGAQGGSHGEDMALSWGVSRHTRGDSAAIESPEVDCSRFTFSGGTRGETTISSRLAVELCIEFVPTKKSKTQSANFFMSGGRGANGDEPGSGTRSDGRIGAPTPPPWRRRSRISTASPISDTMRAGSSIWRRSISRISDWLGAGAGRGRRRPHDVLPRPRLLGHLRRTAGGELHAARVA